MSQKVLSEELRPACNQCVWQDAYTDSTLRCSLQLGGDRRALIVPPDHLCDRYVHKDEYDGGDSLDAFS
jgi:hypothetical protein